MWLWTLFVTLAAALTPLSFLPTLRRVIVRRTADGLSMLTCAVAVTSYGAWLVLARGHTAGMYLALLCSATFAWVQLVYVRRWLRLPYRLVALSAVGAVAAAVLAWWVPPLALVLLVPVDLTWYVRAVRDIIRSSAAAAVSAWGWVLSMVANFAWAAESIRLGNDVLAVQCSLLFVGASAAFWATLWRHRRASGNPTPAG